MQRRCKNCLILYIFRKISEWSGNIWIGILDAFNKSFGIINQAERRSSISIFTSGTDSYFIFLSIIFSLFWVKTSGMDARAQAHNIAASGLQLSGFRQDERVLESILDRYIMPLTVMGGAAIGLLSSATNLLGALVGGTAILLVIMIMYQFYQNIAQQHAVDMHPAMRKFMGG